MKVDISKYISEDEIKQMVHDEIRESIQRKIKEDIDRIIVNSAYEAVWNAVDENFDMNSQQVLKDKIINIINDMTSFNVFKSPNAWEREINMPYGLLMQTVKNNTDLIEEKVKSEISNLSKTAINQIAKEVMKEKLSKL